MILRRLCLIVLLCSLGLGSVGAQEGAIEPGAPIVEVVSLDAAGAVAGSAVEVLVRVRDGDSPLAGAAVRFVPGEGGGRVVDRIVRTDERGVGATLWILGTAGPQALHAESEGGFVTVRVEAEPPAPGTRHIGRNGYVEYHPGDLPIVLSAPHGGDLRPPEIPRRPGGVTVQDRETLDLARRIAAALEDLTGGSPHLVIMNLHRQGVDANREVAEAAYGQPHAERAWHEYHGWIEAASRIAAAAHGRALYVDVHGHGHAIQRVELGYLLTSSDLNRSDNDLDGPDATSRSSIRSLVESGDRTLSEVVRGETSLGELLERRGVRALPSARDPAPGGDPYFSGGYSTVRHGSRGGGPVDGIQLEVHRGARRTEPAREEFARAFADAVLEFLEVHAGLTLRESAAGVH
jgi:hypothetical protein